MKMHSNLHVVRVNCTNSAFPVAPSSGHRFSLFKYLQNRWHSCVFPVYCFFSAAVSSQWDEAAFVDWFLSSFVWANRGRGDVNVERFPRPSSASIRSPSSKAANPCLLCRSSSVCGTLSFDSLRCIMNTLACPGAMIHFLGRRCQLSKTIKKESELEMLYSCRPPLIYDCSVVFFCSLIPMEHVVGSNRSAALDFVDISQQCVFVRCFAVFLSAHVRKQMQHRPPPITMVRGGEIRWMM